MPPRKRLTAVIKLQINAGAATPAPPVGPALGQHGVNIMEFCKAYNAATESQRGNVVPVEITVYEDRSFTFVTKTPPAAVPLMTQRYVCPECALASSIALRVSYSTMVRSPGRCRSWSHCVDAR